MTAPVDYESIFSGIIGQEYDLLKLICPLAAKMSHLVGESVKRYCLDKATPQSVLELGGGTGITTLALLTADDNVQVLSIDNAETMQKQARQSLEQWLQSGRLSLQLEDILTALENSPDASVDIVASAYTLHNFEHGYRDRVITEIYRVLKPGGLFVNGDRYALDDVNAHTRLIQQEVQGYFSVLIQQERLDILEHWIVHLFSDESENHVMRETPSLEQLQQQGFRSIQLQHRQQVNALVSALK
jgi:ubiquinone/menaquinone biosynthesis C-methylase UbiE